MTQYVKKFVENNIDLIETKDYVTLFNKWYDNSPFRSNVLGKLYEDAPYIGEFVRLLLDCGVNYDDLYAATEVVLRKKIKMTLKAYQLTGVPIVYVRSVFSELNSGLAIRKIADLHKLIEECSVGIADYDANTRILIFK